MKKSRNYAPYLFAFIICTIATLTNNRLHKPGLAGAFIGYFFVLVGLWRLIEGLLNRSDNKLVQWGSVLLGSAIYIICCTSLDFYVLHLMLNFTTFTPWVFGVNLFMNTVIATIFIENKRWEMAREEAEIENLNLQAENIEAKFQLLKN